MNAAELPLVLTLEQAAEVLSVNPKTLRAAIRLGRVPGAIKVGRIYRIGRDVLVRWAGCELAVNTESR